MLTDAQIEKLKTPTARREIPDGKIGGLYLVVQPSGAKSFALRYRVDGAPKKFTIGPYPEIGLGDARKRAQKALAEVVDGKDPSAQKKATREAARAAASTADRVETVVEAFVTKYLEKKSKPSWAKEAARLLRVEIVPKFGKRRLSALTSENIEDHLDDIAKRAPITANRSLAVFRKLCNWAMTKDGGRLIRVSPCANVKAPTEERSRDRVLSEDEVRLAWRAFENVGWPFGPLGKLLLLTGARRDEVASMRWREIDLPAAVWRLPASRTKNKHAHEIPLSDAAVEIIKALPRIDGEKDFVFTTTGKTSVSGFSRAKAIVDATVLADLQKDSADAKAPEPWTMHDLRRTVATNLQKLGVKLEVTEAVLNHVSGSRAGIVGIYQRHEYSAEKRAALDAWARKLDAIVTGTKTSNVVDLAAARAS